jgi:hypothetical protein
MCSYYTGNICPPPERAAPYQGLGRTAEADTEGMRASSASSIPAQL